MNPHKNYGNRLKAMIELLDDPDKQVFETVEKELLKENHTIIPELEKKWENSFDENSQERIENLIQDLQFKETKNRLQNWIASKTNDLLEGFLTIDRFQYPDMNLLSIHHKIESIEKSVWLELNNSLTLLEKTTILNHFLFNINCFSINHSNIQSPQNCYLNQLLETRKGNPVSMAAFYLVLARKLGLPARFTDFPKNPLIAIVDSELVKKVHGENSHTDVLFYINPSNKGSITSRKEIDYHLNKHNYTPIDEFAEPKSDLLFIFRLLETLHDSFKSAGFEDKELKTGELLGLFTSIKEFQQK